MILKAANTKPMTEIRRHTAEVFEELRATLEPVIVTEHGRSVGVIMDAGTFDLMNARLTLLEQIAMGEMEISAGEHVSWEEVKEGLKKWRR